MKRFSRKIGIVFIGILIGMIPVSALEGENVNEGSVNEPVIISEINPLSEDGTSSTAISVSALPKEYSAGEFSYIIDSLEILVYDASEDEDGNSKLFNREVLDKISVTDPSIMLDPKFITSEMSGTPGTFVHLNLNIDSAKFEELVRTKIPSIEDNDNYYFELVVNYHFSKITNTTYPYPFHVNVLDMMIGIFTGNGNGITKISPTDTVTSQVINSAGLRKENGVEIFSLDQSTESSSDATSGDSSTSSQSMALMDYVIFSSKEELTLDSENSENATDGYIFMFHNLDDIENILANYDQEQSNGQIEDWIDAENQEESLVVDVPNTNLDISKLIYINGTLLTLIGGAIIILAIKNKKKNA